MSEFFEVKTSELVGAALDWAVAVSVGEERPAFDCSGRICLVSHGHTQHRFCPSSEWNHGGPLIESGLIEVSPMWHNQHCAINADWEKRGYKSSHGWHWVAYVLGSENVEENHEQEGGTPLVAAMRCIVSSKLGDVVQVPKLIAGKR